MIKNKKIKMIALDSYFDEEKKQSGVGLSYDKTTRVLAFLGLSVKFNDITDSESVFLDSVVKYAKQKESESNRAKHIEKCLNDITEYISCMI